MFQENGSLRSNNEELLHQFDIRLTLLLMDMHFLLLFFPSMHHLLLLSMSGLLILENLIIWIRINPFFLLLIIVTLNKYLLVMIDLFVLQGLEKFKQMMIIAKMYYLFHVFRAICCHYQINHSGERNIVYISPHPVVIKDLKYPKHALATTIVDNITMLYIFDNFRSSSFP